MKMKLLSPAGDMESLKIAVFNGADEVYLGVKDFNARNIEGFNTETLKQAVDFCHIFSVRVHLTVNILFTNDELQDALDLVVNAYNLGVDAFIIQDIGLASLIHNLYPEIEMHASTQMGIHNLEGVRFIEKLGFKRVVLSRETPLDEIKRIHENSSIEIEYFVQGALCVSFSGNCYLSSYMFDCSGNRGKCKQLCRLPYALYDNDKKIKEGYLLSAKDFNMLNRLDDLANAGVVSLKIEGRARRPYYVGEATKTYRQALDNIVYKNNLELAFNRGYTEGYFNGNNNIISNKQNHIGIEIGKVIDFKSGKKFNEITFSSNREISPKSTLKFFGSDEVVISAFDLKKKGDNYIVTTTSKVSIGDTVNLINDFDIEQSLLKTTRKLPLVISISAKINENIKASVFVKGETIEIEGEKLEKAKSSPLTKQELVDNFNKTNLFTPNLTTELDNVFILKSKLNEFRRQVYDSVIHKLTDVNHKNLAKTKLKNEILNVEKLKDYEFVENYKQMKAKNIIYSPSSYDLEDIKIFKDICLKQNKNPILNLPNFALSKDIELLKQIITDTNIMVLANNVYALVFDTKIIAGPMLNIYNNTTANYLNLTYLTAEGDDKTKVPYMTLRHCPMKEHLNANCANCPYREGFKIKMQNGNEMKLKRIKMSTCTFYLTD